MPSAASGSVIERKVSGAISATPIFSTGQLQPQTSASTTMGANPRAEMLRTLGSDGPFAILALVQRARLRHPSVAADAPAKLRQPRVERVDVVLAPARDLAIAAHAHPLQHPFQYRADTDDQFQVIGRIGHVEQQRRRVVLEVDDDLAIARGLGAVSYTHLRAH